ncbi:HlyD family secretion protein [Ferrimonas sediminum]|nr:HlyD family secretion protein [Ferrimonas sediminum]
MNSGKKKVLVALTLVLVISGLYLYLAPRQGWVETDNAYVQGEITPISAEVAGVVTRVLVTDNQWVEAGTLLAQLDKRNYLALKDKAAGALAEVEAGIVSARQQIEMQAIAVREAETGIDSAATDARYQRVEWQRLSNLLQDNLASKSNHDAQKTRMERADLALTSSRLKLEGARQALASARTQLDLLQARRVQAESQLALAELNLEDTDIRAPVAGVVGNRAVRQGRLVAAGTPLLSIVPTDEVWVNANFKEGQLTQMMPGQPVAVRLDSFPGQLLNGRVESVSPATGAQFSLLPPDNATGNFVKVVQRVPVKIVLELPQELKGRVVPGLSAVVEVDTRGQG